MLKKRKKLKKLKRRIRGCFVIALWLYFLAKILVPGCDVSLLKATGIKYIWLTNLGFYIFPTLIFIYGLIFGFKEFILAILCILAPLTPLVLLILKIASNVSLAHIKAVWTVIASIFPFSIVYITNVKRVFRLRVALMLLFCLCCIFIYTKLSYIMILLSLVFLLCFLLIHYLIKTFSAAISTNFFTFLSHILSGDTYKTKEKLWVKSEEIEKRPMYIDLKIDSLVSFYCIAKKLRAFFVELSKGPVLTVYFVSSLLYTVALTVVVLGFAHYALFSLDALNYSVVVTPKLTAFLHLSLDLLLGVTAGYISPVGKYSQYLATVAGLARYFLILVLGSLLYKFLVKQYKRTIKDAVKSLGQAKDEITATIRDQHNLSIDDAIGQVSQTDVGHALLIALLKCKKTS